MTQLVKEILLESIRADERAQARIGRSGETVAEYRDAMLVGQIFPPLTLFFDGKAYWIGDGFHRYWAAVAAGKKEILAEIREGGLREAKLYAASANITHGLRRTNEDKRRAVLFLLEDRTWRAWSDRQIAQHCGVSHTFVGNLRQEMTGNGFQSPLERMGADGRLIDVRNIGKQYPRDKKPTRCNRKPDQPCREHQIYDHLINLVELVEGVDIYALVASCDQSRPAQKLADYIEQAIPWFEFLLGALRAPASVKEAAMCETEDLYREWVSQHLANQEQAGEEIRGGEIRPTEYQEWTISAEEANRELDKLLQP